MSEARPPASPLDYGTPQLKRSLAGRLLLWCYVNVDNAKLAAGGVVVVTASLLAEVFAEFDKGAFLSLYAIGTSIALLIVAIRGRESDDVRYGRPPRLFVAACALLCLIGAVHVQSCPHTRYLAIGPALIPLDARACHNPQPFMPFWPAGFLLMFRA